MWSVRRSIAVCMVSGLLVAGASAETQLKLKTDGDEAANAPAEKADGSADQGKEQGENAPKEQGTRRSATRVRRGADAKQAQTRPTARNTQRRGAKKVIKIPAAANAIVQELRGEFERGKLRDKSDYLASEPNAEMTPGVIIAMLTRNLGSSDSMDGYIKWQLLSGLPETISEEMAADALEAYRNAPPVQWRPGITQEQKQALDREIKRVDNPLDVSAMLIDEARRVDMLNEPILEYRDSLLKKLPDNYGTLQAALVDVYQRAEAGTSPRKLLDNLSRRMSDWAATANEEELEDMSGVLDELLAAQLPSYYETVRSNASTNAYSWDSRKVNLNDGSKLADMADTVARKAKR